MINNKYYIFFLSLSCFLGVLSFQYGVFTFTKAVFFCLPVFVSILVFLKVSFQKELLFLVFYLTGSLFFFIHSQSLSDPYQFDDQWVEVKGRVVSMAQVKEKGKKKMTRFELRTEVVKIDDSYEKYMGKLLVTLFKEPFDPIPGETYWIKGKWKVPKQATNEGQFDYRAYLKTKQIQALLYVFGKQFISKVEEEKSFFSFFHEKLVRLRRVIKEKIRLDFQDPNIRSVVQALSIGERGNIAPEILDTLKKTGAMHFLAISGLHLSLLGFISYTLLMLFVQRKRLRIFCSFLLVSLYSLLSFHQISVVRSYLMVTGYLLAVLVKREKNFWSVFGLALLTILLINPPIIGHVGFQLSFLAVFSLVFVYPCFHIKVNDLMMERRGSARIYYLFGIYFANILFSSLAVLLLTSPLLIYHFHLVSLSGFLGNLLGIPILTVVLFLQFFYFLSFPFGNLLSSSIAVFLEKSVQLFLTSFEVVSRLDWLVLYLSSPHPLFLIFYYFSLGVCVWLVKGRFFPQIAKVIMIALFSLLLFLSTNPFLFGNSEGGVSLTVFDCGQNQAVLLCSGKSKILLNSGGTHPSDYGRWVVAPYLMSNAIKRIDQVLMVTDQKRYWSALTYLNKQFILGTVSVPQTFLLKVKRGGQGFDKKIMPLEASQQVLFERECRLSYEKIGQGRYFLLSHQEADVYFYFGNLSELIELPLSTNKKNLFVLSSYRSDFGLIHDWLKQRIEKGDLVIIQGKAPYMKGVLTTERMGMLQIQLDKKIQCRSYLKGNVNLS